MPFSVLSVQKKSKLAFSGSKVRLMLDVASNYEGKPVLGKPTAVRSCNDLGCLYKYWPCPVHEDVSFL